MKKVLITGATGLIGRRLTEKLIEKGYFVNVLSRSERHDENERIRYFVWDVESQEIDTAAVQGISSIIHLAGAGIADKRWTDARKKIIIDSRVNSAQLLYKTLKDQKVDLDSFISASGINYYGAKTTDKIYSEEDPPGNDFTSECCVLWEKAADQFTNKSRVVKLRTGIVLSGKGGALDRIALPIKWGLGAALGKGSQYTPFIHIDDLCSLYIEALENEKYRGTYNAISPEHLTNSELTKAIAKVLKRPLILPNVPAFVLKTLFGEMSEIILEGSRASAEKVLKEGFGFKYPEIKEALAEIYG